MHMSEVNKTLLDKVGPVEGNAGKIISHVF